MSTTKKKRYSFKPKDTIDRTSCVIFPSDESFTLVCNFRYSKCIVFSESHCGAKLIIQGNKRRRPLITFDAIGNTMKLRDTAARECFDCVGAILYGNHSIREYLRKELGDSFHDFASIAYKTLVQYQKSL